MTINIGDIVGIGTGLNRPECVLAHSSGLLFASNCAQNGGISIIRPDGTCSHLLGTDSQNALKPNGIALEPEGSFLAAHLGTSDGGVFRLDERGKPEPVVTHANGHPLPPTNFVIYDTLGRLWITVSTTIEPRANDYRQHANTGFIALAEPGQSNARIVADRLGYTNECVVDVEEKVVYVNETFGRRLTRFDLADDGSLSNQQVLTTFNAGTYPDGLALDEAGNLWVTSIVSNRIIKVSADGTQQTVFEDSDANHLHHAEMAYASDTMDASHLATTGKAQLKNTSSLAFGSANRSQIILGNLLDDKLYSFQSETTGRALPHWDVPLGFLEQYLP